MSPVFPIFYRVELTGLHLHNNEERVSEGAEREEQEEEGEKIKMRGQREVFNLKEAQGCLTDNHHILSSCDGVTEKIRTLRQSCRCETKSWSVVVKWQVSAGSSVNLQEHRGK